MRLGIAISKSDPWDFFHEIYASLNENFRTSLFKERKFYSPLFHKRITNYLFRRDMQTFMLKNEVIFFEWASNLLACATHFPKRNKIITRLHRYEMYRWVEKIQWDFVDKIILVSKAKQEEFILKFPNQGSKTIVIPQGISLDKFTMKPKPFNGDLGILCHITPRKRVYELVIAFSELVKRQDGFHLHIGGGPLPSYQDYYTALHQMVIALDLQDHVTFYGNVTNTSNWYHGIDIFISNSYSEGLQVAPMEAMASGCYCLSHHWAGADELLPDNNLFISEFELQEKVLRYSNLNEGERQSKRKTMREIVAERFNIDKIKVQIRQVIEEVGMYKF
jgi:glycosyltransferase involved in cell wall biosynthesis